MRMRSEVHGRLSVFVCVSVSLDCYSCSMINEGLALHYRMLATGRAAIMDFELLATFLPI